MGKLIDSVLKLLLDQRPDELTSLQISGHANTHVRYLADFFGGQGGLFLAAYPLAVKAASSKIFTWQNDELPVEVRRLVNLWVWLSQNMPEAVLGRPEGDIFDVMSLQYQTAFGIEKEEARLLAQQTLGSVISYVLIGKNTTRPGDYAKQVALHRKIAILLGTQTNKPDK